jgi:hypothetical protein
MTVIPTTDKFPLPPEQQQNGWGRGRIHDGGISVKLLAKSTDWLVDAATL